MSVVKYKYRARHGYDWKGVADTYEYERFSGMVGRYRYWREQQAVGAIVETLPQNISIADCPCGTGRWWPVLARRASRIVALDIADEMIRFSRKEAKKIQIPVLVARGDAERLCIAEDAVDYVFSHALTKHLPLPLQCQVLQEFSRVASKGVVCSFGIFTHMNYEFWRRRKLSGSYPVMLEQLHWMAREAGLVVRKKVRCTTPIGVENTVLLERLY